MKYSKVQCFTAGVQQGIIMSNIKKIPKTEEFGWVLVVKKKRSKVLDGHYITQCLEFKPTIETMNNRLNFLLNG